MNVDKHYIFIDEQALLLMTVTSEGSFPGIARSAGTPSATELCESEAGFNDNGIGQHLQPFLSTRHAAFSFHRHPECFEALSKPTMLAVASDSSSATYIQQRHNLRELFTAPTRA